MRAAVKGWEALSMSPDRTSNPSGGWTPSGRAAIASSRALRPRTAEQERRRSVLGHVLSVHREHRHLRPVLRREPQHFEEDIIEG